MKAVLIDPNSAEITRYHDPYDIDDPHTYRARQGFIGIGDLWAGDNNGTVYLQGHLVIPNDWGNVSTNGETTTTTDDTTDKDGGDDVKPCIGGCPNGTILCCHQPGEKDRRNIENACLLLTLFGANYDECVSKAYENWVNSHCYCEPPPCITSI